MAHVILTVKPWAGSDHVSEDEGKILFVSDVTIDGIPIICESPEEKEWYANGMQGTFVQKSELSVLTACQGFMGVTIKHPTKETYEALLNLGLDEIAEGYSETELTVLVSRLNIEVLEPSYA